MKKLLPVLLALIGTGAGVGAGIFLAPAPSKDAAHMSEEDGHAAEDSGHDAPAEGHDTHATEDSHAEADAHDDGHGGGGKEYVKMSNQFVVPIVQADRVGSLVVLSLSLEVTSGGAEQVYAREPKLRDSFLRVLFDHANIGGFEGNFTETQRLDLLRRALLESARNTMGSLVIDVLITEIARQDS